MSHQKRLSYYMIVDHFWKNKASINCIIPCILSYMLFKTDQNADLPPIEAVHATLVRHLVRSPRICNCPGRSAGRYTLVTFARKMVEKKCVTFGHTGCIFKKKGV